MLHADGETVRGQQSLKRFNGHPPLGVNATKSVLEQLGADIASFNGHPPLGVNATADGTLPDKAGEALFQWAPTLGGECYLWSGTSK